MVLNAFVQPVASRYIDNIETALQELGIGSELHIMKSNGGTSTFDLSKAQPIHLIESGPVGGVIGARAFGEARWPDLARIVKSVTAHYRLL